MAGISSAQQSQTLNADHVQSEIAAIDSILKELSTGDYSVSNMGVLAQLTDGTNSSVSLNCRCKNMPVLI